MTILFLALLLCWDPNSEPDLFGYWVTSAELHVDHWIDCPCDNIPDNGFPDCTVPPVRCPVYNDFVWQDTFTGYNTIFSRTDCAHEPNSVCFYKWPRAADFAGNLSLQPMIPGDIRGECP